MLAANACGSSLAANSDCALSLAFDPTQAGGTSGTLILVDGDGTQTVVLSGTGATAASDALSPTSLSFPATASGLQSAVQTVTLTNRGDLALTSISLTASVGFQQSSTCGTQLTGHASCSVSVVFAPTTVGSISGNLSVSDAIRTQTISLSGVGLQPAAISVNPAQLTFSAQLVGQAGSPLPLTISNTGGAPMSNIGFQITGQSSSSFSWNSSTCGSTLNNGGSCTVQVAFTPSAPGVLEATLVVTSSTLGVTPVQVPLGGIGQAASGIVISPDHMFFTQPTLGQASATQTTSITNTSNASATGLWRFLSRRQLQPRPEHLRLCSGGRSRLLGGSCVHADGKRSRYRRPHRQLISFRYRCRRVVDRNRWCCRFGPVAARIAQLSVDRCRQHRRIFDSDSDEQWLRIPCWSRVINFKPVSDRVDNVRGIHCGRGQLHREGRICSIERWAASRESDHLQFIAGCGRSDTAQRHGIRFFSFVNGAIESDDIERPNCHFQPQSRDHERIKRNLYIRLQFSTGQFRLHLQSSQRICIVKRHRQRHDFGLRPAFLQHPRNEPIALLARLASFC